MHHHPCSVQSGCTVAIAVLLHRPFLPLIRKVSASVHPGGCGGLSVSFLFSSRVSAGARLRPREIDREGEPAHVDIRAAVKGGWTGLGLLKGRVTGGREGLDSRCGLLRGGNGYLEGAASLRKSRMAHGGGCEACGVGGGLLSHWGVATGQGGRGGVSQRICVMPPTCIWGGGRECIRKVSSGTLVEHLCWGD